VAGFQDKTKDISTYSLNIRLCDLFYFILESVAVSNMAFPEKLFIAIKVLFIILFIYFVSPISINAKIFDTVNKAYY
jgi:hypothetical protein